MHNECFSLRFAIALTVLPDHKVWCGRYEELKKQLLEAQSQAEAEDEEAELARAAAAVARLTAPAAPSEGAAKDAFWSAQRVRSRLFGRKAAASKGTKLVSSGSCFFAALSILVGPLLSKHNQNVLQLV